MAENYGSLGFMQLKDALNVRDHPTRDIPDATEHHWGDSPSERPYNGPAQKSNIPEANPHTNDPWNKAFND